MLTSSGGAREHKDAGADDGADAERGERPWAKGFPELVLRTFSVGNQLVYGFAAKQLIVGQWDAPSLYVSRGQAPAPHDFYLLAVPRTSFFTLLFLEPRAYSRGLSGFSVARFLRAVRLAFLRSSLLNFLVFAMTSSEYLIL